MSVPTKDMATLASSTRAPSACVSQRKLCGITCMFPSGLHGLSYERDRPFLVDVQLCGLAQLPRNLAQPRALGIKQVYGARRRDGAFY